MIRIDSPVEAFETAEAHLRQRQLQPAEAILRQLVDSCPDNIGYNERLIEALYGQKKLGEAFAHFSKILARFNPTGDPVYGAAYLEALVATKNSPVPLRRLLRFYELINQLRPALGLSGEVVECGCFRGMSSFLLCHYLRRANPGFTGAGYHIFDSFQGLPRPTEEDDVPADNDNSHYLNAMSQPGAFAASLATVRNSLASFPGIEYHPGWIPISFKGLPERQYRFVHVDVDLYDPTWDCLDYFYPRLVPGGALVSDDYSWPGARKAVEEFCSERGLEFTVSAYHQAVLHKKL